jgi:hypothetical protein
LRMASRTSGPAVNLFRSLPLAINLYFSFFYIMRTSLLEVHYCAEHPFPPSSSLSSAKVPTGQCCETATFYYVPVPTFDKFQFRFRLRI